MLTHPELTSGAEQTRSLETGIARPYQPALTLDDVRTTRRTFIISCVVLIVVSFLIAFCLIVLSVLFSNPGSAVVVSRFAEGAATLFEGMETQGWAALGALSAAAIPIALVARQVSENRYPDAATYVGGDILQGAASILGAASVVSAIAVAASGGMRWFALTNIVAVLVSLALVALAAFAKISLSNWELQTVAVAAEMRREEISRLEEVRTRRDKCVRPLPWRWLEKAAIATILVLFSFTCGLAAGEFTLPLADIVGLLTISLMLVVVVSVYAVFISAQLQVAWDRRNIVDLTTYGSTAVLVFLSEALLVLANWGDPVAWVFATNLCTTLILVAFDRRTRGPATLYAWRRLNRRIGRLTEEEVSAAGHQIKEPADS